MGYKYRYPTHNPIETTHEPPSKSKVAAVAAASRSAALFAPVATTSTARCIYHPGLKGAEMVLALRSTSEVLCVGFRGPVIQTVNACRVKGFGFKD